MRREDKDNDEDEHQGYNPQYNRSFHLNYGSNSYDPLHHREDVSAENNNVNVSNNNNSNHIGHDMPYQYHHQQQQQQQQHHHHHMNHDDLIQNGGSNENKNVQEMKHKESEEFVPQFQMTENKITIKLKPDYSVQQDLFDEEEDELFAKTTAMPSISAPNFRSMDEKAHRMMRGMGFESGKGIGARLQGISEQIRPRHQFGKAGLGSKGSTSDLGTDDTEFDDPHLAGLQKSLPIGFKVQKHQLPDEIFDHRQSIEYLHCDQQISDNLLPTLYQNSVITDPDKSQLSPYCEVDQVEGLMKAKSQFDSLDEQLFRDARSRANPYERIGKSIFQNRAAVKMANLDKVCKLVSSIQFLPEEGQVLYFADICAGPGGFTEYLYWRRKTSGAKGFGFTLRGKDDFRLDKFNSESPHDNFECLYGVDDTGDITKNENLKHFANYIEEHTPNGNGVALMMGDGGFSVQGNENNQEYITRQLIMCQFLCALLCLRKGGTFVCKTFDLFTQFSASLVYIMYQNFEEVGLIKPFTSRPANSERYIVCRGLRQRKPQFVIDYLFQINQDMTSQKRPAATILSLVNDKIMDQDKNFTSYLARTNVQVCDEQIKALDFIKKCVEDKYLDTRHTQIDLKKRCLEEWDLPAPQNMKRYHFNYNTNPRPSTSYQHGSYQQPRRPPPSPYGKYQQDPRYPSPYYHHYPPSTPGFATPLGPMTPGAYPMTPGAPMTPSTPSANRPKSSSATAVDPYSRKRVKSKEEQAEELRRRHLDADEDNITHSHYQSAHPTSSVHRVPGRQGVTSSSTEKLKRLPKIPKIKAQDDISTGKDQQLEELEKAYRGEGNIG